MKNCQRSRKMGMEQLKSEISGEIMIEAVLVFIPTLFVIVFLIALGFIYYQQWNVQYVADAVAEQVALSYGYDEDGGANGELTKDQIVHRRIYRYSFGKDKTQSNAIDVGQEYGAHLFELTNLAKPRNEETIDVKIEEDSLGRRHAQIHVKGSYHMYFAEGLHVFGFGENYTYEATSLAECYDMSALGSTVMFTKNGVDILLNGSKIKTMVNDWFKAVKNAATQ